jgi:hypothetical protein
MTPQQEQQFNNFGCISRCLIKLAETKQQPIAKADFCEKFQHFFPNPTQQYGGLLTSEIAQIARSLGLGRYLQSFRRYAEIDEQFNKEKRSVLVSSEINLDPYHSDVIRHCNLLTAIDIAAFSIWCPYRDGTDGNLTFQSCYWDAKCCHGWVLL